MNPKLIILQFGVNIVPHIVNSYTYYENQIYQQITALKKANPGVSVMLIGVSDMSRKVNGRFESYPNIELIRDAQRNGALRAGAAFWDCYRAMGGKNSMPAWVYASPQLASKDFVHFTYRGSNIIAEMFYSSLMELYDEFALMQLEN
jgi:lysophospholipase L1-like esterase